MSTSQAVDSGRRQTSVTADRPSSLEICVAAALLQLDRFQNNRRELMNDSDLVVIGLVRFCHPGDVFIE